MTDSDKEGEWESEKKKEIRNKKRVRETIKLPEERKTENRH